MLLTKFQVIKFSGEPIVIHQIDRNTSFQPFFHDPSNAYNYLIDLQQ